MVKARRDSVTNIQRRSYNRYRQLNTSTRNKEATYLDFVSSESAKEYLLYQMASEKGQNETKVGEYLDGY